MPSDKQEEEEITTTRIEPRARPSSAPPIFEVNPEKGVQHSIYAIDPLTKKRFYEPHKQPGCSDVYCLSSVTQIGERICDMENKLMILQQLFAELIKKRHSAVDEIVETEIQHNISQANHDEADIQLLAEHQSNVQNSVSTNYSFNSRHQINNISSNSQTFSPSKLLCSATATANISRTNFIHRIKPGLSRNVLESPITQQRPAEIEEHVLTAGTTLQQNTSERPVYILSKELRHGLRIYFPNLYTMENTCPVCFAVFANSEHAQSHIEQHSAEKQIEPFICLICCSDDYAENDVQFLSLPAVVQHLLNQHGITGSAQIQQRYQLANNTKRNMDELQRFLLDRMALLKTTDRDTVNLDSDTIRKKRLSVRDRSVTTNTDDSSIRKTQTNTIKQSDRKLSNKRNDSKKRHLPEAPLFNSNGDCLDRLLDCAKPCTLFDRISKLKEIDRTAVNHLIVNITENMLGEKDLQLANNVAILQDWFLEKTDQDVNKERQSIDTDDRSIRSKSTSFFGQRESRSCSSKMTNVISGKRRRSKTESTEAHNMYDNNNDNTTEDDTQSMDNNGDGDFIIEESEKEGNNDDSDDMDYYQMNKPKKRRHNVHVSNKLDVNAERQMEVVAVPSLSQQQHNLPLGDHSPIPSYRVVVPRPPNTKPSSALMQHVGYVASKGIYIAKAYKEQQRTYSNSTSASTGARI